ncbi:MAG: hypothetical protein LBC41_04035 [Clostridiales bacterium]|nr:hypothetical protein [Clostridiales bacterium]MDR2749811.1 hypothetical protein [Clostridiales bacterium]
MGAFELNSSILHRGDPVASDGLNPKRLREECIIALKVYDSCRQQDCLTPAQIGPARSAEQLCIGDEHIHEGDIIDPPDNAAAVTIDRLRIKKIIIVDKKPNPFKNGYWDVDLKYVFEYRLIFREADGTVIGSIRANSIFNRKLTLFGSIGSDLAMSTDLFRAFSDSSTIDSEPFIMTEAKAVALTAELHHKRFNPPHHRFPDDKHCPDPGRTPNEVLVTIGLFSIVKLFRVVNLTVESRGFCVPEECEEISPLNPCEFFDSLDFPLDIFAPPQKPEFAAGISGNIPKSKKDCGC